MFDIFNQFDCDNCITFYSKKTVCIKFDELFCILEKYVGICGNALKLIKSYLYNRTQRVQIDNVLSVLLILIGVFLKAQFWTFKILFVFIVSEHYFKVS